ncbi:hypothetical protein [Bacillus sp. XT-2]|nr:hypothetical protein [Bacillus sp. XT-2]MCV0026736.1 hypothetical protein [Bacillus sp. XT-2]
MANIKVPQTVWDWEVTLYFCNEKKGIKSSFWIDPTKLLKNVMKLKNA